jgi:hypothetical protein
MRNKNMSTLKKILVIGIISFSAGATQACFAAQKSDRSLDQEVVVLTDHVQKAQDAGRITPRQAVDFKNKEEKIVAKADDMRDENGGEIRVKDATKMRSKLFSLDEQLSHTAQVAKYR